MSKIVFIKDNSPEIREKLKQAGFSICVCASFSDSVWLDYHPEGNFPFNIHGEGFADKEDLDYKLSPLERIQERLKLDWYYSKEREFYSTVEEFLEVYGNKKCKGNT
jgi:hypothetical protein